MASSSSISPEAMLAATSRSMSHSGSGSTISATMATTPATSSRSL